MTDTRSGTRKPHRPPGTSGVGVWAGREPGPDDFDVHLAQPYEDGLFQYREARPEMVAAVRAAVGEPVLDGRGRHRRFGCDEEPWASVAEMFVASGRPREVLVNWNAPLQYHVDVTAPYAAVNAVMFLRHACRGGLLVFPDRRVAVEPQDGWVLLCDAQREVHGVTPLIRGEDGWRCSVVFYVPVNQEEATDGDG